MTDIAKMVVRLEAQTEQYQKKLERAQKANMTFGQKAKKHFANARVAYLSFAAAVGGAMATISAGINRQAELFDLSTRLGASAEGLSRLQYAAEQTGVSVSTLNMGLQRMVRRVAEAANGTGEARGALEELGVSADALKQLAPEEQFAVLADKIMAVESPADRVRLAMKLFDSEGVSLIQTMQGGSEQLARFGEESDRLGRTIDDGAAAASKRASDAITRFSSVLTGSANVLASQFAPEIEAAANWLATAIPKAANFANQALLQIRRGFLIMTEGIIKARIAWNEFTRDTAEAESLRQSLAIVQDMGADLVAQQDVLRNAASELGNYGEAVSRSGQSYENFVAGTNAASGALDNLRGKVAEGTGTQDAINREFSALVDSLRTKEEKMIAHYARRKQIIIENTEAESQLRLDLLRRLDEQYLAELDVTQQKVEEKKKEIAAPAPAEDGTPAIDRIFGPGAIGSLFSDFENIEQRFKEMLARMLAEALASQIASAITGGFSGTGIGNFFGGLFGGARAMGGPVSPNTSYLVGEKGPEMFVPNTAGSIVPNHQMDGGGGNVSVIAALGDAEIEKWMGSKTGERVVLAHIKRNASTVQAVARA